MNYAGKKILIIGSGVSGTAAAVLLKHEGALPVILDQNEKLSREDILKKLPEGTVTEVITGSLPEERRGEFDLVVPSPGVPVDTEFFDRFREQGIPVIGETELAYSLEKGKVLAITGTNGKTTTTTLVGEIMKAYTDRVFVVGNIGRPYTQEVTGTDSDSVTVAEISSFQLETSVNFRPVVSAILNITPDHLNRHHTMENYVAMKEKVAANQDKTCFCILNHEDGYTRAFGERTTAVPIYFSSKNRLEDGYYLEDGDIMHAVSGRVERLMNVSEMRLLGVHNAENVMAAIAMTAAFGVPMDIILKVVKDFRAVEHRIEFVENIDGVDYYNDSKGTNPDAAIRAIEAMNRPTVLIGGGYDKDSVYDEWIESFGGKVKHLVLIGVTADKIEACALKHGFDRISRAESLEEAVKLCRDKAQSGDAVLLSPACASWDMFKSYEDRGRQFKELVRGFIK